MELVLLHALPFDGAMWHRQMDFVPGRTHAPTLYGLGPTLTDWARGVLGRVAGPRLVVVGNSIGGACALEMARLAPERVAALVLVGAKAGHRPAPRLRDAALATLRREGRDAAWVRYWAPLFAASAGTATLSAAKRLAGRPSMAEFAIGVRAFHARDDRRALLPALRCSVIGVSGRRDPSPGPATMRKEATAAQDGRLIVVPACGHYVPLERPQAFNALLRAVLERLA
ncbi:MAG: alpha/beta hydrolase [Pseudomonadota bacterium]